MIALSPINISWEWTIMKTILMPTDGSEPAVKALDVALDLACQHEANVRLLHVLLRDKEAEELLRLPDVGAAGDNVMGELESLAKCPKEPLTPEELMANVVKRPAPEPLLRLLGIQVLNAAQKRAADRGIEADVLDLADGEPAQAIVAAAEATGADAIVMGTRGLRNIDVLTFGSVSQEVCRVAPCTCVAVH